MTRALSFSLLLTISISANAADVWVLGGVAYKPSEGFCNSLTLGASTTMHNPTGEPLDVTLIETTDPNELIRNKMTIPPHRTATIYFPTVRPPLPPSLQAPITMRHLDVPESLLIDSHLEIGTFNGCTGAYPGLGGPIGGMVRLPVFRRLIPAGETTTHMGTELPGINDARLNLAVYNAGDNAAQAHIEVFRGWEDKRLAEQTISIPPKSIVQSLVVPTFAKFPPAPVGGIQPLAPWWVFYTRVTVDQPSLSVVSVLSNVEAPRAAVAVSE